MRGLVIDLVRERRALKRGGEFHITRLPTEIEQPDIDDGELSRLSDALDELALTDPRVAEISEARRNAPYSATGKRRALFYSSN